jgi:GAF domain-containing protein
MAPYARDGQEDPVGEGENDTVAGLVTGLSELSSLVLGTDALDRVVWEAAMLAVHAADDVAACGVTVLREGAPLSIMPDEAPFGRLENFQYEHDAGPLLQAMRERRTVLVGPDEAAFWPAYADLARELGVTASIVVPLRVGDDVLGALNLYATGPVDLRGSQMFGELVADLASTALSCMARQAEQVKLTDELRTALESRAVIEQAKGLLMSRGHTPESAFGHLRRTSQNRNIKLRDVATIVVDLAERAERESPG